MARTPLIATGLVAALFAGWIVGRGTALGGERREATAVGPQGDDPERAELDRSLHATLARLASAVEGLEERLSELRPSSGGGRRQPLPADPPPSDELLEELRELNQTLRRGIGAPPRSSAARDALPAVDRAVAFAFTEPLRVLVATEDGDGEKAALEELIDRHFLWTTDDLLEAYGRPDWVGTNERYASWQYELIDTDTEWERLTFKLLEGRVTDISYSYSPPGE